MLHGPLQQFGWSGTVEAGRRREAERTEDPGQGGAGGARYRHGPPALAQLRAVRLNDQRQVEVTKSGEIQVALQHDLARCLGPQVGATDHVGNPLRGVVHDHGQLVGVVAIAATQQEVAGSGLDVLGQVPVQSVADPDLAGRYPEPQACGASGLAHARPAVPRVDRFAVRAVSRGQFPPRAGAGVDQATPRQVGDGGGVGVGAAGLAPDRAVPGQSGRLKGGQDRSGMGRIGAGAVDVLDPHEPPALVRPGVQPRGDGRTQRAQVQRP